VGHSGLVQMKKRSLVLAITATSIAWVPPAINAQTKLVEGTAEATGCHVVEPDQTFKPIYTGPPRPPDFKEIANRSNIAGASLRHHLETLPAVPKNLRMANPLLSSQELQDVVAFIITLRDKPAAPTR
jgi:hypothetical protein